MRKASVTPIGTAFSVHTIPVLKDNFSYLIHDHRNNFASFVDVSEVKPVMSYWETLRGEAPTTAPTAGYDKTFAVLTTHKHWDHCGGNKDIAALPGGKVTIYGGKDEPVPFATDKVGGGDTFSLGALRVAVHDAPCHTSGHVMYEVWAEGAEEAGRALFTGDTLFVGGVGAFFEGDAKGMQAILDRVATLPKETKIFCGHEYTVNFIKFALSLEPTNAFIQAKLDEFTKKVAEGIPTIPSELGDELKFNPFMRTRDPIIAKAVGKEGGSAVEVMQAVYNACP